MIVCVKCQAEMQQKELGKTVIRTTGSPPKAVDIWRADLFGCPICNAELLTNFGYEPVMEAHEQGFGKELMKVTKDKKYILHSPEHLARLVKSETRIVRRNGTH